MQSAKLRQRSDASGGLDRAAKLRVLGQAEIVPVSLRSIRRTGVRTLSGVFGSKKTTWSRKPRRIEPISVPHIHSAIEIRLQTGRSRFSIAVQLFR